jgi:hypothetical protein
MDVAITVEQAKWMPRSSTQRSGHKPVDSKARPAAEFELLLHRYAQAQDLQNIWAQRQVRASLHDAASH